MFCSYGSAGLRVPDVCCVVIFSVMVPDLVYFHFLLSVLLLCGCGGDSVCTSRLFLCLGFQVVAGMHMWAMCICRVERHGVGV